MPNAVLNIAGYVGGLASGSEVITVPQLTFPTCHGGRSSVTLAAASDNTINIPPTPSGGAAPLMAIISFASGFSGSVFLKGVGGDTGFRADATPSGASGPLPILVPIGGAPASIIIRNGGSQTVAEILWL